MDKKMAEKQIACNVHYKPLPMFTAYKKLGFKEVCRKENYREVNGEMYDAITWRLDF